MVILLQSAFVPDHIEVTATAPGLTPATVKVQTTPPGPDFNIPPDLTAKQPTIQPIHYPANQSIARRATSKPRPETSAIRH